MAAARPGMTPAAEADAERRQTLAVRVIAAATGVTALTMTVWFPFLPLFMLEVGATDAADAIFWVAVAQGVQGFMRLISGPLWGSLADRHGRKKMFVRALYCGSLTTFILCAIDAPWQASIALGLHGLLSGFVPAAIALTSVTVPDRRLKNALNLLTGGQYLGTAMGPMLGAALVLLMGYRAAIFGAGLLVLVVATAVVYFVPADAVRGRTGEASSAPLEPFRPNVQLQFAAFLYFVLFALNAFRGVATPISLQEIAGGADVAHITGIAFGFGGIASALGIWALSAAFLKNQRVTTMLVVMAVLLAAGQFLLATSTTTVQFVAWFTVVSLLNAAMAPMTNTLIAFNISRERRGTAFGLGASAQALGFMVGPMAAAAFARYSLQTGFAVLGVLLLLLAVAMKFVLREPKNQTGG